jgi:hypothetical protein
MALSRTQPIWNDSGRVLVWAAVLLAPSAVVVDIGVGYTLVQWVCATGNTYVLALVSIAALAIAANGIWLGWSELVKLRGTAADGGGTVMDRNYFLAGVAVAVNALVAIIVVTAAVPQMLMGSCE